MRQTTAQVEEGHTQNDGALVDELALAQFLVNGDLADRPCRTHFRTKCALQLAMGDVEIHDRCPQSFEATFGPGCRLQHIGRARVDALVALDALLEELGLLDRPRRPDQIR